MLEEAVRAIPFLRGLPASALRAVASRLEPVALADGDTLFHAGEPSDAVYLVESGRLAVLEPDTGRDLATLGPGSVVGETGLLLDAPRSATVTALAAAELWKLSRGDVDVLVAAHPQLGVALGREVGRHLLNADERRLNRPPRLVVVAAPGAVGLADAIAAEGVDPVGVLALDGDPRTTAQLPAGVAAMPPSLAMPDALAAFATEPAGDVTVLVIALPAEATSPGLTAAALAEHGVDLVEPLPPWAASLIDPLRRLHAPRNRDDLRRMARWVSGRAVGLALSSGGSKTVAHIGALKVLQDAGVPIDAVAGTSGGSVAAAGHALGLDHEALVRCVHLLPGAFRYRRLGARMPPREGLFSGANLLGLFERWYGSGDIADAAVPLFIVAADVADGSEVVLRRGPVAQAVRASMGIPGVFTPTPWNGRWLTDGGIVTPLPTRVLRDAGVGVVVASNVAGQDPVSDGIDGPPGIVETLGRIVSTMERQVLAAQIALADVTIRPVLRAANSFDFRNIEEYLAEGERAARVALPAIEPLVTTR